MLAHHHLWSDDHSVRLSFFGTDALPEMHAGYTPPRWATPAGADERFLAGILETSVLEFGKHVDDSAYASYALVLRFDPRSAHAALQLAWIDRLFGTPITAERVTWLRSLGVRDEAVLGELATRAPLLTGPRHRHRHDAALLASQLAHAHRAC